MRFYKINNCGYGNPDLWYFDELKAIKLFKYKGNLLCYFKNNSTDYVGFVVCKDSHIIRKAYVAKNFWDGLKNIFGLPEKAAIENLPWEK
jgi:hypothetical protein